METQTMLDRLIQMRFGTFFAVTVLAIVASFSVCVLVMALLSSPVG